MVSKLKEAVVWFWKTLRQENFTHLDLWIVVSSVALMHLTGSIYWALLMLLLVVRDLKIIMNQEEKHERKD